MYTLNNQFFFFIAHLLCCYALSCQIVNGPWDVGLDGSARLVVERHFQPSCARSSWTTTDNNPQWLPKGFPACGCSYIITWYGSVATKLTKHASERPAVKDTPRSAAAWKQETKVTKKHERTHRDFLNSTYLKIN